MTIRDLPDVRGRLLDELAASLDLPPREVDDPSGHVCTMESDGAYRRRLATWLGALASRMMEP